MAVPNVVINELLCYIRFNYIKVSKSELCASIVSFYTTEEVVNAKNVLFKLTLANGLNINDLPKLINRKSGENKRRLD
jgi:hypothetical protein